MLIDAITEGGQKITLKVESCIALVSCSQEENRCQLNPNELAQNFNNMINGLIDDQILFKSGYGSSVKLPENFVPNGFCDIIYQNTNVECGDESIYIKYDYPAGGELQNIQTGYFVTESLLNSDPVNGCYFSFVIPGNYELGQVSSIANIQPDPRSPNPTVQVVSTGEGGAISREIYHFTATAYIEGQAVQISGSTCLEIFDCVDECSTHLHELCYLSEAKATVNLNIPSQSQINDEITAMQEAHKETLVPIWRPYTTYAIKAKTRDRITGPNTHTYDTDLVLGFKTDGPAGFFHRGPYPYGFDNLNAEQKEQIKLKDLKYYIDYDKSYPSPSGNVLYAKPLYYTGPEINLYYIKNYLTAMYNSWAPYQGNDALNASMSVDIYDPRPADSVKQTLNQSAFQRVNTNTPPTPVDAQMLMSLSDNGDPCAELETMTPPEFKISVSPDGLQPEKMYSVVVKAMYEAQNPQQVEIFRFTFQTSRYGSFQDHISSFNLGGNSSALYDISVADVSSVASTIQSILDKNLADSDDLHAAYANDFDKIITGLLKSPDNAPISNTPPPTSMEVNVLRDSGNLKGIWLRSIEPINDPRLPENEKQGSLAVLVDGVPLSNLKFLYSKDMAEVFITTGTTSIPPGVYQIDMDYLLFDGQDYVSKSSASLNFTIV